MCPNRRRAAAAAGGGGGQQRTAAAAAGGCGSGGDGWRAAAAAAAGRWQAAAAAGGGDGHVGYTGVPSWSEMLTTRIPQLRGRGAGMARAWARACTVTPGNIYPSDTSKGNCPPLGGTAHKQLVLHIVQMNSFLPVKTGYLEDGELFLINPSGCHSVS
eukprot:gene24420-biopygen2909